VWQTSAVRLLGAGDGTLTASLHSRPSCRRTSAALPLIDDVAGRAATCIVGDRIDPATLSAALRLAGDRPRRARLDAADLAYA